MTPKFRVAHAAGNAQTAHWSDLARACVAALGPGANEAAADRLGFVYVTDYLADHLSEIVDHLRLMTGLRDWVGTVGIGVVAHGGDANDTPEEDFDLPAMAVMIGDFPAGSFRLFEQQEIGIGAFSKQHGSWIADRSAQVGLVHGDPRAPQLAAMLESLSDTAGLYLVGGLASSRGRYPLAAERVGDGGISGVLFAGEVGIATGLSQGCSPIGPVHTITESEHNILKSIDHRPALDVFKQEIGEVLSRNLNRAAGYIFAALPVPGSDTGDYLVRNVVGIDPERGWIAIGDLVSVGSAIMFTRRDRASAKTDLDRMLEGLRRRIDRPIRGGIYVSCVSRGASLFGPEAAETRRIVERLGSFPLIGFFANGEINHRRLYGHTGVLTLFY